MDRAEQNAILTELTQFLDTPFIRETVTGYINRHDQREPIELRDVCDRDELTSAEADLDDMTFFDSTNPACAWMVAELIIAWQDADQSAVAPW